MNETALARLVEEGEVRVWPLHRSHVEIPDTIAAYCRSGAINWQPSRTLSLDSDGKVQSNLARESRHSMSVPLSVAHHPLLWNWLKPLCAEALSAWCARHPDYFPPPDQITAGQLIRYREGDFFTAHADYVHFPAIDEHRVLMCLVGVSEGQGYDGGELCFETLPATFKLGWGDVIVYPAALTHEVLPVTGGERLTMLGEYRVPLSPLARQRYIDQFWHNTPVNP